jgi:LasA protease
LARRTLIGLLALLSLIVITGCVRNQPQIVVVTSEFDPALIATDTTVSTPTPLVEIVLSPVPEQPLIEPTPDATRPLPVLSTAREYIVQPGDTLSAIAAAQGVSLEMIISVNELPDPNSLTVGQVINLPAPPDEQTSDFKIVPDSRLVRGPGNNTFDISGFIAQQPGYIHLATDTVNDQLLTATQVVQRISLEYSVDARLLLALLEHKASWLSKLELDETAKIYPLEGEPSPPGFDRSGLYRQLAWAANQLNLGYYGWKYRGWTTLEFEEGVRLLYAPGLNAATVGVQYFLSQNASYASWLQNASRDGLYHTYFAYFGDPFAAAVDPLVPPGLVQPELTLPFAQGETWFFTGGPHGGWGSGSAWSAVDFAPPDDVPEGSSLCYISENWATAVAPGIIARSGDGSVVLDLDMDNNEATGWTILYLHMATDGRVAEGTVVQSGTLIGRPSCEGGFSNATHMHIARRYNGEWIPVQCDQCATNYETPSFVMSGWTLFGLTNQEYQGYMTKEGEQRDAEQGRLTPINWVSW